MGNERSTVVVIGEMHPALQGVVRLAASSLAVVVEHIALLEQDELISCGQVETTIVVLHLQASGTFDELRWSGRRDPRARVVVLGDVAEPKQALEALRAGVYAFVSTSDGLGSLPDILRRVARGEHCIPSALERTAVCELGRSVQRARAASSLTPPITSRQREVLELLAEGFTTRQIGRRLGISPRTAEAHVGRLYDKLAVRTRVQAITRGVSLGLVELA